MNDTLALFGSITTVMAFAAFIGIAWMAYAPRFAARHDRDAMIPFLDSQLPAAGSGAGGESDPNS